MFQGKREGGDRSRNGLVPGTFKPYRYRGRKVGLTAEERAESGCPRGCPEGECYCSEPLYAEMNDMCTGCGAHDGECYCGEE
jgi:hypothetical protein